MSDLNKCMLIGNLTKDPETKTTSGGKTVSTFTMATNKSWTDNGVKKEQVEFHNIVVWGGLSDVVAKYCNKGMKVFIEGRLTTRTWDDQNGVKRYRTEIVAENMQMLSKSLNKVEEELPTVMADDQEEEIQIEDIPF